MKYKWTPGDLMPMCWICKKYYAESNNDMPGQYCDDCAKKIKGEK